MGEIAIHLVAAGINDHGLMSILAADEVGFTAVAADLFKVHHIV